MPLHAPAKYASATIPAAAAPCAMLRTVLRLTSDGDNSFSGSSLFSLSSSKV
jgi:hypothetical protein